MTTSLSSFKSYGLLIAMIFASSVGAAERPLNVSAEFDLSKPPASPITFFELMNGPSGIKAKLDADYLKPFKIVDDREFREKADHFAAIHKLEAKIQRGPEGLDSLLRSLEGKTVTEDQMYGVVYQALSQNKLLAPGVAGREASRLAGALAPVIGIASGKGVLVRLDPQTYCYNYGYAQGSGGKKPEQDQEDRKTGRSYGASINRNAYDPSDNDYLRELSTYIASTSRAQLKIFYMTLFEILLKAETTGLKSLEMTGQTVMADFMAIYMAELDRHLMTGLTMYEWENALTEITMLAAYSADDHGLTLDISGGVDNAAGRTTISSSKIADKSKRLLGFFGVGTDGSGLDGANKRRRHAITSAVVAAQRKNNPRLVARIEGLIGVGPGKDIYDETMNQINNFKTQDKLKANADELIDALVEFILETKSSAADITAGVDLN